MKYITKLKLAASHQYCDIMDKSTEFTIEFLKDSVGVDNDCVLNYLSLPESEHQRLRNELNDFLEFFEQHDAVWEGMEADNG